MTVVRLITSDTIEEAVLALHAAQRELARGVLEGAGAAAAASTEQLFDLIRGGVRGIAGEMDEESEEAIADAEEAAVLVEAPRRASAGGSLPEGVVEAPARRRGGPRSPSRRV